MPSFKRTALPMKRVAFAGWHGAHLENGKQLGLLVAVPIDKRGHTHINRHVATARACAHNRHRSNANLGRPSHPENAARHYITSTFKISSDLAGRQAVPEQQSCTTKCITCLTRQSNRKTGAARAPTCPTRNTACLTRRSGWQRKALGPANSPSQGLAQARKPAPPERRNRANTRPPTRRARGLPS